jgi:DNA-binding HxlR family transcriptional regulator
MKYKRGMGKRQMAQAQASSLRIAKFLSDEKPHQFKEIKKATKLSPPTLSKRLKELVEVGLVNKKVDTKSGKYPYPVYYTATGELSDFAKTAMFVEEASAGIEEAISAEKQPLLLLDALHMANTVEMVMILKELKKDKSRLRPDMIFNWQLWALEPYRALSLKIIEASAKVIEKIDIDQIQKTQLEAWKYVGTKALKNWKKSGKS